MPPHCDPPPLADSVGFALIQMMRQHRLLAELRLNEIGLHTGQEILILRLAAEGEQSQSQLAEFMGVEPPTVTKMLQRLEGTGYLARRKDPADARVTLVGLTELGHSLESKILVIWEELEALVVNGISPDEQSQLRRLVGQMHDNLRMVAVPLGSC